MELRKYFLKVYQTIQFNDEINKKNYNIKLNKWEYFLADIAEYINTKICVPRVYIKH